MNSIMLQLRDLHTVMIKMIPKERINQHPFDYFRDDFEAIRKYIQSITKDFEVKLNEIRKCSNILRDEYRRIVKELSTKEADIPEFTNVYMEIEYVVNELERISNRKRQLENDIFRRSESIYEVLEELGVLEVYGEDRMFSTISQDDFNIECLRISNGSNLLEQHEEIFRRAGLEKEYLKVKELISVKSFFSESLLNYKPKESNLENEVQRSEEVRELYMKINNQNIYSYAVDLLKESEISIQRYSQLEITLEILQLEKLEREKHRRTLFKNISSLLSRLGIVDHEISINLKLFRLEELYDKYSKMVKEREEEVIKLLNDIRSKEELLNLNIKNFKEGFKRSTGSRDINLSLISNSIINDSLVTNENDSFISRVADASQDVSMIQTEINGSITTSNIDHLKIYLNQLTEEYNSRMKEIFSNTKRYLEELCKLFTLEMGEYELTSDGIGMMRQKIEELEPKKELYMEILSLIETRENLLESMNEFEKIASDPRRLFKSSFQLLREEKFRKSAFPSLLKLEEKLFKQLDMYKERFGEFMRNDSPYATTLKEEIDGRIVNKTVFINKFDSPMRKKKN